MTMILGLMGAAGSGKSTVAKYLEAKYGARRYSLADPLKEIAMRTLLLTNEQCYGTQAQKEWTDPRYGFSARWFLQRLGTEGCRAVLGENVWTDALLRRIVEDAPALAVVEDVRFTNESIGIREAGGIIWRLEVEGQGHSTDDGSHVSEREWRTAPFDFQVRAAVSPQSLELLIAVEHAVDQGDARLRRQLRGAP